MDTVHQDKKMDGNHSIITNGSPHCYVVFERLESLTEYWQEANEVIPESPVILSDHNREGFFK